MTDEIFFGGAKYISAQDAASSSDLTRDYVARLCRDGKVRGRRIGKNWYVSEPSLRQFLLQREFALGERSQALAEERSREYRAAQTRPIAPASLDISKTAHVSDVALQSRGVKAQLAEALSMSERSRVTHLLQAPSGIGNAALSAAHVPLYALTPAMEFAHKLIALTLAFTIIFGTFALVDPSYARYAADSAHDEARGLAETVQSFNARELANAFTGGIAAASNPASVFDALQGSLFGKSVAVANSWNDALNALGARIVVPPALLRSLGLTQGESGAVAAQVAPYQSPIALPTFAGSEQPAQNAPPHSSQVLQSPPSARTIITNPVIERVIQTDRVVTSGGISENVLDQKLNQLDNALSAKIFSLTSANSTAIAQTYNVVSQTNRIDQLNGTDISNPSISGGSISGASVSATGLSVTGATTLGGDVAIGGVLSISTSSSGITTGNFSAINGTSTNFFATNASTTNATSTNLFSAIANFTSSVVGTLSSTIASIAGLTATNATTTNATSTNLYSTNLQFVNASSTNATSTNFFASTASSTNLFAQSAAIGALNLNSLSSAGNGFFGGGLGLGVATTTSGVLQTTGMAWVGGDLVVAGNSTVLGDSTTIGNSSTGNLVINSSIKSNIVPNQNISYDLGSPSFYWRNAYIGNLNVNNISAASTTIAGTASNSFTISSANATADTQDQQLIFFRGTVVPNAILSWNSATTAKRFEFNQSLYVQNASASTSEPTFTLQSVAGQTANVFQVASSSGSNLFFVDGSGNVGVGATSLDPSAVFQIDSSLRGFLPPRLTTTQKNAISSPAAGLIVYDNNLNKLNVFNGSVWKNVGSTEVGGEVTSGSPGAILFVDQGSANPVLAQDANNFSYASTTHLLSLKSASTSNLSVFQNAYFGGTATSTFTSQGWLGIGTSSPSSALSVNGFVNVDGTAGGYKIDSNKFIYASSTNFSTILGIGAGVGLDATSTWLGDTAIGYQALGTAPTNNTNPSGNTAVGYQALQARTSGTGNVGIGYQALLLDTAGGANIGIGSTALSRQTTGSNSVAIGNKALFFYNSAQPSVAIGANAGNNIGAGGGGNSTYIGSTVAANWNFTSGTDNSNIAIGDSAFEGVAGAFTGIQNNIAIGNNAMLAASGATGLANNVAIGANAGNAMTSAAADTLLGKDTGKLLTSGSNNLFLGASVASTTVTGSNNIALGYDVALSNTNGSNQLNIGNLLFGTGINGEGTTLSTGNIGIGTSSPTSHFTVVSNTNDTGVNGFATAWIESNQNNASLTINNAQAGGRAWTLDSLGGLASIPSSFEIKDNSNGVNSFLINSSDNIGIGGNITSNTFAGADMTLLNNGNVGIGTSSPFTTLSVNGNGYFTGTINTPSSGGGYEIDNQMVLTASSSAGLTLGGIGAGSALFATTTSVGNTVFGYQALQNATSSRHMTAIGYQALQNVDDYAAANDVAVGYQSLNGLTTGSFDVGVGSFTLSAVTSGSSNIAVGNVALTRLTTGSSNVALGTNALNVSTTGSSNVAIGAFVMANNTTGANNVALGSDALLNDVTGSNNTVIGAGALQNNISATTSVAVGFRAGIGINSLYANQGGTYLGYQSGLSLATSSDYNTLLGYQAGYDITTGTNNTVIGSEQTTGGGITSGSNNILIGQGVRAGLSQTGSNQLNIGNLIFGTSLGNNATLSTGNVGIGTSSPLTTLSIQGAAGSTDLLNIASSTGASALYVSAAGKVGIGTTNPFALLDFGTNVLNKEEIDLYDGGVFGLRQGFGVQNSELQEFTANGSHFSWNTGGDLQLSGVNELMRLTSTGQLGIGTSTPYSKLTVWGSDTSANTTSFLISDSASTTLFSVNDAGQISIPNTNNNTALTVGLNQTNNNPNLDLIGNSSTAGNSVVTTTEAGGGIKLGDNGQVALRIFRNADNNFDITTHSVGTAQSSGSLSFITSGNVGFGTTTPGANIAIQNNYGSTNANIFTIASSTSSGGSTATNFLTVTNAGNVGIGTSSPQHKVSIWGAGSSGYLAVSNLASGDIFQINSSGNIGIGTSTPGSLLSIGGIANFTSATSTFYSTGGINLAGGCVAVNGVCLGSGSTNAGTQGQIAFYNAAGTTISATSTLTILQSSLLGIGTTTPWAKLSVTGAGTGTGYTFVAANNSNTPSFVILDNGSVGVGTTSPATVLGGASAFAVSGNIFFDNGTTTTGTSENVNFNNDFTYNSSTGSTTISNLYTGELNFDYDAGNVGWANLPIQNALSGTQESYSAQIANTSVLTVSGFSNGSGGVTNPSVGVGTSTPYADLAVENDYGSTNSYIFEVASSTASDNSTANPFFVVTASGRVAVGTSTPYASFEVWGSNTGSASTSALVVTDSASTTLLDVYTNGSATLSGTLYQSSDQRLKTDVQSLSATSTLSALDQLNPVSYMRIDQPSIGSNLGFLAQQVQAIFPELVSTSSPTALTPDGTLTLNYEGLIAPIVASIQSMAHITGDFETNLIAWLGNASNGIHDLYASVVHANEVDTQALCVSDSSGAKTCVTKPQLDALLAGAASAGSSAGASQSSSSGQTSSTPPQISVNGNNPATVNVGDTYADLGAAITGPQGDLNLGIRVSVDGGATTTPDQISIDTSSPDTHTILYSATDQSGLIGYASRTVIVASSGISSSTSSSSASTTDATSTATN